MADSAQDTSSMSPEAVFEQAMENMGHDDPDQLAADMNEAATDGTPALSEDDVNELLTGDEEVPALDQDVEGEEEEESEESPEDESSDEEDEKEELSPRGEERFQKLANERNELREYVQQQHQAMQQMQQQMAQLYQQQQEAQRSKQEELAQQQLEALRAQQAQLEKQAEAERLANMSVADRWKYDTEQAALKKAESMFAEKFQSLEQKFQAMEQEKQEQAQKAARQADLQAFYQRSQQAVAPVLEPMPQEVLAEKGAGFTDAVLAYAAAMAMTPEDAAKEFQGLLDSYHEAKLKTRVKPSTKNGSRPPGAPILPQGNKSAPAKEPWPTRSQLDKHGFDDHLDWLDAGSPTLV